MVKASKATKRRPPLPAHEKREKTSLVMLPSIWRAARIQALTEGCSTAYLVERSILAYLRAAKKEA